jgi:hypothetical protein
MVHSEVSVAQDTWLSEVAWELTCDGLEAPIEGGSPYAATHALPLGASCTLKMVDLFGDGWQGAYWSAPAWTGNESYSLGTYLQWCPGLYAEPNLRQRRVAVPRGGGSAGARARTALPVPARSLIAESAWRPRLR